VASALEIYSALGATPQTATMVYTNSAGTGSRTSEAAPIGGSSDDAANHLIFMSLQSGDVGIRSVESVTLSGSTGTAGAFGVTLLKPLAYLHVAASLHNGLYRENMGNDPLLGGGGRFAEVDDNACLAMAVMTASSSGSGIISGFLQLGGA
jgi:hypothetical protein